jgi:hypothetical protein
MMFFVKLSRWEMDAVYKFGGAFFNRRCFAARVCCYCSLLWPAMAAWRRAGCLRHSAAMEESREFMIL